ncbi:MAG: hypothetical protein ACJAVM_000771 [Sulfitobacter sp.]|jgi:hypothetical protein
MPFYEYKVVPAPTKGLKAKGLKTPEAQFSNALQALMNRLAGDGWSYQRAETLPSIERAGLTSSKKEWRHVLVFRRLRATATEAPQPDLLPAPENVIAPADAPEEQRVEPPAETKLSTSENPAESAPDAPPKPVDNLGGNSVDNGVEDTDDVYGIGASLEILSRSRKAVISKS